MIRKFFLSFTIIFAMVASLFPTVVFATTDEVEIPFKDVPMDAWYINDLVYAFQSGLINGRSSDSFAPDDSLTCAEAVKLAACMNQKYEKGFIHLENGEPWYEPYVKYAESRNIIDRSYDWNSPVTRAEYAEIFSKTLPDTEYEIRNTIMDNSIPDVSTSYPQSDAIYRLYRAGILVGNDASGIFWPDRNIKRSEVSAILTRMMNKNMRKNLYLGDNTGVISDTESGSDISDILADFSVNGLAEKSNLVALVRLDYFSDPFEIRPVFGESTQTYVDYKFTVKTVLKGIAEENESITVRIRSSQELVFEEDSELYLCLYKPDMGSGYNTVGNYYYITGDLQGIFERQDGFVTNSFGIRLMDSEFQLMMIAHASADVPFSLRGEFINNLNENLESGMIDQAEYERLLEEIEQYAEIVR